MQKKYSSYQEQSTSTETNIRTTTKVTGHHYFLSREDFLGRLNPLTI